MVVTTEVERQRLNVSTYINDHGQTSLGTRGIPLTLLWANCQGIGLVWAAAGASVCIRPLTRIDVEYVNTPNTSQYVGPAQTGMMHVFNTRIAVAIRHDDCSSSIYGTSESFVTVIKEPSTIRN